MLRNEQLAGKKILVIDKEKKDQNDRTWCFWEDEPGFFEEIVYRKWDHLSFLADDFSTIMNIRPYQYKMIRGIDFYRYCFTELAKHPNVELLYGDLKGWKQERGETILQVDDRQINAGREDIPVFNSIYRPGKEGRKSLKLLQHFKGWIIQTAKAVFNPAEAILMDFRLAQDEGTTFAYLLPFTENTALVEYTLFSRELLPDDAYDTGLRKYITEQLGIEEFKIISEEKGVIPMTNEKLSFKGSDAWHIGTAGGQTKASSGYTFQFIQKQSTQIVEALGNGRSLASIPPTPARFRFYDNTLLYILYHNKLPGKEIFTRLFQKNKPQQVLRFLDNESSFIEELKIISTLPARPFLHAALRK